MTALHSKKWSDWISRVKLFKWNHISDILGKSCKMEIFVVNTLWERTISVKPYIQYTMVWWLSLLQNFIQQSLNSGSAQVQILVTACQRSAMVRISDNYLDWI